MHAFSLPEAGSPNLADTLQMLQPVVARTRTLLLVDDEKNIISALKRLLRNEGYQILTADSGAEGLAMLARHPVDVIVSDQRMPGMTGVEFLGAAKALYPDTVRIVLSGYTELQSVFDAVNKGAIYKFLTKPWDDILLREHIREGFEFKEFAQENRRLIQELQSVNHKLAAANQELAISLTETQEQVELNQHMLAVIREVLQQVEIPVLAIDDADMIAFINDAAQTILQEAGALLGAYSHRMIPEIMLKLDTCTASSPACMIEIDHRQFRLLQHVMGTGSFSRGRLLTLIPVTPAGTI